MTMDSALSDSEAGEGGLVERTEEGSSGSHSQRTEIGKIGPCAKGSSVRVCGGNAQKGKSTKKSNTVYVNIGDEEESEKESEDEIRVLPNNPLNKNPEYERIWFKKDRGQVGSNVPVFNPEENEFNSEIVQNCESPMDYFLLFQQEQYLEEVLEETRRYAIQSGWELKLPLLTKSNLLCTMAVILLSGYNKLPYRNMYWEESVDTYSKVVSDNI